MPIEYTVDWFTEHIPSWDRFAKNVLTKTKKPRCLLAGVYEGRVAEYILRENIDSKLVVFDDFEYVSCVGFRGVGVYNPAKEVKNRFIENIKVLRPRQKVDLFTVEPRDGLAVLRAAKADETFDLIYIDSKSSKHVMECLVLAFPLLKKKGVIVITNNVHGKTHGPMCPRRGIDGFLDSYVSDLKVLHNAFHLFIEKRIEPLVLQPCHAEYFDPEIDVTCHHHHRLETQEKREKSKKRA